MTSASYLAGFSLSIVLTLASFAGVAAYLRGALPFPVEWLAAGLIAFAALQLLVQSVCFLHLGEEARPRWRLFSLLLTLLIVAILMGGTLWIMRTLGHEQAHREIFVGGQISPETQND